MRRTRPRRFQPTGRTRQGHVVVPSPERRHGWRGGGSFVHTVVKDFGAGSGWPMLTKANYSEWSMVMKG